MFNKIVLKTRLAIRTFTIFFPELLKQDYQQDFIMSFT